MYHVDLGPYILIFRLDPMVSNGLMSVTLVLMPKHGMRRSHGPYNYITSSIRRIGN